MFKDVFENGKSSEGMKYYMKGLPVTMKEYLILKREMKTFSHLHENLIEAFFVD